MKYTQSITWHTVKNAGPIYAITRPDDPALRQPMFDWKASDKYKELHTFCIEVKNIFMTNNYNTEEISRLVDSLNSNPCCCSRLAFIQPLLDFFRSQKGLPYCTTYRFYEVLCGCSEFRSCPVCPMVLVLGTIMCVTDVMSLGAKMWYS